MTAPLSKELAAITDSQLQHVWESVQEKMRTLSNRWLIGEILPEGSDYRLLFENLIDSKKTFKGIFRIHVPNLTTPVRVSFTLTNRKMAIGQIKQQIEKITGISRNNFNICFKSLTPIGDNANFFSDFHCNGKGGEVFDITFREHT